MAQRITALVLMLSMLVQNLAELRGGRPRFPATVAALLPDKARPGAALIIITVILVALIPPAILTSRRPAGYALALAAGGLALNAVGQVIASFVTGTVVPGTMTGAFVMFPAALAALWLSGRSALRPALVGACLSPVILVATWHLAAVLP
jgi:hypothetical protein